MKKGHMALIALALVAAGLSALSWGAGSADDGVVAWEEQRDGHTMYCYEVRVDLGGELVGDTTCSTSPLPEDCAPMGGTYNGREIDYRSALGYAPDSPTCEQLMNTALQRHRQCEREQSEAGLTDQEEIWRICLND